MKRTLHLHLEFRIQNLHVQSVLKDLLLANALRFGFIAFFVFQSLDLMVLCQSFDHFWFQIGMRGIVRTVVALRAHATYSTARPTRNAVRVDDIGPTISTLERKHHQPFVVFFGIVLFVSSGIFPRDVGVLDGAKVGSSIGFDNDKVSDVNMQARPFLNVEDIRATALEVDYVKWLGDALKEGAQT